jgi:hypothetical protein
VRYDDWTLGLDINTCPGFRLSPASVKSNGGGIEGLSRLIALVPQVCRIQSKSSKKRNQTQRKPNIETVIANLH